MIRLLHQLFPTKSLRSHQAHLVTHTFRFHGPKDPGLGFPKSGSLGR